MMRLAFSTIACPEYTPAQAADAARRYGYDGVELYALWGERLTPDLLAARLPEVRDAIAGVPLVCINSWARLSSSDADERRRNEDQIARTLELAASLACPLVKTFGGELPPDHAPHVMFDYMAQHLWRLAARGRHLGVTLVLETHDGFSRSSHIAALLERVPDARFAALWDVHHPYRMGETTAETDRAIGARVAHAHVKDAARTPDGAWQLLPVGAGELPVREMLARLAARGYDGYVSLDWEKMWHPGLAAADEALPHHAAILRPYLESSEGRGVA